MWQTRYQYVWTVYGYQLVPVQVWVPATPVVFQPYAWSNGTGIHVEVLPSYR